MRYQSRPYRWLPSILVVFAAGPLSADDVGVSGYYPLNVGNEWRYAVGDRELVVKVAKHEKKGDYAAARVESYIGDQLAGSEHIAVTDGAILRVAFNDVMPTKPVTILTLPPKAGTSWRIDTQIDGGTITGTLTCSRENVTVPAGTFTTFKSSGEFITTDDKGEKSTVKFTYWYADGVGLVKASMAQQSGETLMLLKKFTPGKTD